MTTKFELPDPGEGISEAEILEVRVAPGDTVADGQIVFVVETDKAAVEVPAPRAGTIATVEVSEGDIVPVGDSLLTYEDTSNERDGEAVESAEADSLSDAGDPSAPEGGDTDASAQAPSHGEASNGEPRSSSEEAPSRRDQDVLAAPATRKLARELGVDLAELTAGANGERVTAADVRAAARNARSSPVEREATSEPADTEKRTSDDEQRVKLRSVRRTVARRMARAWEKIPHVSHTVSADITELERFRHRMAEQIDGLTLTVVLCKALAATLARHPRFNAELDDDRDEIVLHQRRHIGIAVDTDKGLLVPVLRDADRRSLAELAAELEVLTDKAKSGKLAVSELRGATCTLTNMGAGRGEHFTPIINYPQAAILGAAPAVERPHRVEEGDDDALVWRLHLPLILSFDHRLNDGMDAARFFETLSRLLEDPARFAAEV